jgi:hypothetical protein
MQKQLNATKEATRKLVVRLCWRFLSTALLYNKTSDPLEHVQ